MDHDTFASLVRSRLRQIETLLTQKGKEYSPKGQSRLHNFTNGAEVAQTTPQKYLWTLMTKHLVSLRDMLDQSHPKDKWDEKLNDSIAYLCILGALIEESR